MSKVRTWELSAAAWRRINFWLAVFWLLLIAPAWGLGWLESVVFVSAVSLYANVASHVAGWRADVDSEAAREIIVRLDRLEERIDATLAELARSA